VTLLIVGACVGAAALWLDGWSPGVGLSGESSPPVAVMNREFPVPSSLKEAATYLSYFAIVFLAVRWWKMTERRRPQRFSAGPVLAATFWALLLLLLWKDLTHGAVALVFASLIVQVVSPWQPPTPPTARRLRLRYA
jgi:hypothetical protein